MTCPKCQSPMSEGFMLDKAPGHGRAATFAEWMAGPMQFSFFGGVKVRNRRRLPVRAMRCDNCGFLELYAPNL